MREVFVTIVGQQIAVASNRTVAATHAEQMVLNDVNHLVTLAEENGECRRNVRVRIAKVVVDR